MAKAGPLYPSWQRLLAELGENIKLARLRRRLSTEQVAERVAISRPTLSQIEKGNPPWPWGITFKYWLCWAWKKTRRRWGGTTSSAANCRMLNFQCEKELRSIQGIPK